MSEKKFGETRASESETESTDKGSKPFENEFVPYIHRWGRITNLSAAVLAFGPALVLAVVFGLIPSAEAIVLGSVSILSVIAVFWFVEPLSYYPVLGIPGTYMAFLSGNISNMRLPCSAAAQEATGVEVGTKEGSIISTLGIAGSIFVNVTILSVGVFIGVEMFQAIPETVRSAIEAYIVPSIFGAVFVQFARDYLRLGAVALAIALPLLLLIEMGYFALFPGPDPSYVVVLSSVFGTIAVARYMFRNGIIESPKGDEDTEP